MSAELDRTRQFRTPQFPRVAAAQPVVRFLHLIPVLDDLAEDPVVVTDPVTERGQFQRRHGIQETRRQTTQTAVAESGIDFLIPEGGKFDPEFFHRFLGGFAHIQIDQRVPQGPPHQEFQRDVIDGPRLFFVIGVARGEPTFHDQVADAQRQCLIEVQFA